MKSSWGNVKVCCDRGGRYVRGCIRKKYARTHPYPPGTRRIKPLQREKAAIVMLRKHGYPINMLSKVFGRSTSFIHRCLRFNILLKNLRSVDMRKLPGQTRVYARALRWRMLLKHWPVWYLWILGEEEEPP